MSCSCENKTITIYQGFSTFWNGRSLISVSFDTDLDLDGFSAIFKILNIEKTYTNIKDGFNIDLTKQETARLPVGLNYGELIIEDNESHKRPFTTALPFNVENWVSGDIHLDNYKLNVHTKIKNNILNIKVETAGVDPEEIEAYISAHNLDESSHPYILNVLNNKVDKVSSVNRIYGTDVNGNQTTYDINSLGTVKDVEVDGQSVVNQNGVAEIDLTGKQNVIDDLSQIRDGAALGATSVQPDDVGNATLDIQKNGVTVNTFTANSKTDKTVNITVPTKPSDIGAATSAQGALADTALQPSDITTGSTNGTIAVSGTDVSVYGLGSAAYTASTSYATSAQGTLADSALQPSDVVNNTTSTATDAPLSANMGKSLQDQVDNLKARGRYLALWNCATGLAQSNPPQTTYTYQAGDYFIVGTVASGGGTNYKPSGSIYTTGVPSTVIETADVAVNDVYYYDGTSWSLQINTQKEISFGSIAGDPYDNTNLASALNGKVPTTRTVNGKDLSSNISLTASDVGALPDSTVIPTVNNATLTIQKNGTTVNTFTANASSNVTANITVPTDTNDLTNGAGYITGINSTDVTTALGYTPYDSSNPNGYTSNTGTVTSVNNVSPVSGNVTLSIPTVNNPTITITQGGETKGNFTLNQASGDTIALDAGSSYTAGTGIDITNNEISVASPTLVNTATNTYNGLAIGNRGLSGGSSISIGNNEPYGSDTTSYTSVIVGNSTISGGGNNVLIGYSAQITYNYGYAVCIGSGSKVQNSGEIAIGYEVLNAGLYSIGIGYQAKGQALNAIAIGRNAKAGGDHSIQIGYGTNSEASTFCVGFNNTNYKLLDGKTGKIPDGRLPIATSVSSSSTNEEVVGAKLFHDTVGDIETLINAL